jgi:hypothetical protein
MPRPERPWIVTPHGPIVKHEANLWTVDGLLPGTPVPRRMAMARRQDGTVVCYHAIPLQESALAEVLAWGTPTQLVVGNASHGVDAAAFAKKLGVKLYGPRGDARRMRARWEMAGTLEDLPADPGVAFESVAGTKAGEPVELVRSGDRLSLIFCDAIQNHGEGGPLLTRLLGFRGGPRVVPIFKLLFTSDRAALKADLLRLAALPGLTRLIPCHGAIVDRDAPAVLRAAAAGL